MKHPSKVTGAAVLAVITSFTFLAAAPAHAGPGYALSFNGTNNYVWINRPVSNDFTIEFWFASSQVAGTNTQWWQGMGLVDGEVGGSVSDFGVSLGAGTVVFGTGGGTDISIRSGPVADGKWHHVAATRVRASGQMRLYVDGALVASATGLTATLNTSAQLRFGSLASGVNYFRGSLDEVKIWSTARSQAEIQAGMHHSPDLTDANLAGYWPFREGPLSVQTADVSGRGRPGRLVNRPMWALSPAGWTPSVQLNGANRVTNECHTAFVFVDPGAVLFASPATFSAVRFRNLALKADGTVVAWGYDPDGQNNVPPTATNVVALAAGGSHSLALKAGGTVVGWGANIGGATTAPPTATNVVAIAAGSHHSLALKGNGTVVAWGDNYYGATNVPARATNIVALAAVDELSLALRADGAVVVWGYDTYGQTNVPPAATNVVALAPGGFHSLALKADGTIVAWGNNSYGQTTVPVTATNVVALAAGSYHSLALRADGTVVAWGNDLYGQTTVPVSTTNVVALAAGSSHSLTLKADGTVVAWGGNTFGQTTVPESVSQLPCTAMGSGVVDTNTPGYYQLAYSFTNLTGNVVTTNRTVVVADRTAPVVTLNGPNPLLLTNANRLLTDPGATAWDACGGPFAVTSNHTVNVNYPGTYTITYSATDTFGNTGTNSRLVHVALPPATPGDLNGDGVVDGSELNTVLANYWPTSPWLQMTNVAGLGGTNVTFALTNDLTGAFSVEATTNLADWLLLGPAIPRYGFVDTNAPVGPQRYYRLRWP